MHNSLAASRHLSRSAHFLQAAILLIAVCGITVTSVSQAATSAGGRTPAQVIVDFNAAVAALPRYPLEARLDPRYRQQMSREFGDKEQRLLNLIAELETVSPRDAVHVRGDKCLFLVRRSLDGNAEAMKSLTDLSNSAAPADAVVGKMGLLALKWWSSADDTASQKDVAGQFAALAKANPQDNILVSVALTMARYRYSSDEVANLLRDVVDQDLKGKAAVRYQNQPEKIGRPFNITIKSTTGVTVSTAQWKGKVVLVDFWATWCPPCRAALPGLVKLYNENHAKGLEVMGISNDSSLPDLKQFLAANKEMAWPESFNPTGANNWNAISTKMSVKAIPTTFIIDRDGILRDIEVAYVSEELVKKLLNTPSKTELFTAETPAGPAPTVPAAAPVTQPAAAPAAPPSASEQKATALLSLANNYIAANRPNLAKDKLNELMKKYPDTAAAKKAKDLLGRLN